jgi:hypothetical protein
MFEELSVVQDWRLSWSLNIFCQWFERHVFQVLIKKNFVIANFEHFRHINVDLDPDSATASMRIRIQENAWMRIRSIETFLQDMRNNENVI